MRIEPLERVTSSKVKELIIPSLKEISGSTSLSRETLRRWW
jgi:hypothetical protein